MVAAANTTMIIGLVSIGVITWLFSAFSTAALARSNGQSYNLWLIFGLITGPIGLCIAYIYFRMSGERYRRTRYGEGRHYDMPEMVKCPACGESVPRSFESCQFCGSNLHGGKRR